MDDVIYVPKSDILDLITEEYEAGGFTDYSNYSNLWDEVDDFPAADVQPVTDTENMATVSDEFICKKCGIYLKDYIKVVLDEDNDGYIDEQHYEYEPKFCPECGAKVKECETNG